MRLSFWYVRALPIAVLTLALLLAYWLVLPGAQVKTRQLLADRYERDLATAAAEEIPGLIAALDQLGEAGLPALLRCLVSPRPELSQAAATALNKQVQTWRKLPPQQSLPLLAQLLKGLSENPQAVPQQQRALARQWALLALTWPQDTSERASRVPLTSQLLGDSERLLQALPAVENGSSFGGEVSPNSNWPLTSNIATSDLPGGNLPIAPATSDDLPTGPILASRDPREPSRFTPDLLPVDPVEPRRFIAPRVPEVPREPATTGRAGIDPASANTRLTDLELMRDLNSDAANERIAAARDLRLRGYQPLHLAIAAKMTHPEAAQRRKLVEELPRLGGINPAPWLKYLCEDEDASVRQAAKSILATGIR